MYRHIDVRDWQAPFDIRWRLRRDGHIHAEQALPPHGWRADVRVAVEDGPHRARRARRAAAPATSAQAVLLPAMPNLHSHAFQRGMAGLAETARAGRRQLLELARGHVPLRARR